MSSPGWFGMTVVRPLGCSKNMWLPCCLLNSNPYRLRTLVNSFADKRGNFDIVRPLLQVVADLRILF